MRRLTGWLCVAATATLLAAPLEAAAAGKSFIGQTPPEISAQKWLNSPELSLAALRGRVVLLEFWSPG
jgi:hypothetical protein